MMNIRRTSGNEGLRRAAESCLRAVGKFHSALSFGFLWIFRKIGALLARIPWNFRASLGALAAALILLVAVSYGTELLLLSGFTEIVPETPAQAEESAAKAPERVNPDDEFSETKLTADVPGARERFAPLGQLKALREADPATVNPDRREMKPEETAEACRSAGAESITGFGKAMFRYWTEDGFASRFRRMLTLEQYRDPEMGRLYQQYLAAGPLGYMDDLFRAMALPRAQEEAARFYAPMFLLYSVYDASEDKAAVLALLDGLLDEAGEHLKEIRKEGQDHAG